MDEQRLPIRGGLESIWRGFRRPYRIFARIAEMIQANRTP